MSELRFVRPPNPVHFPESEQVPESKLHLKVRTLLFQFLERAFADRATIGSDQFVYWDRTDPKACLAPDAFVRWGEPDRMFRSWKVWERGAPHLAIEVVSSVDERDRDWEAKLERYRRLGVQELVRFDPEVGELRLRIWASIEDDLVERGVGSLPLKSQVLPGYWLLREHPGLGITLRLSEDEGGERLYQTADEAAAQRIRDLEAQLAAKA